MDQGGNIYSVEQMRRELEAMGTEDPRRAELERKIAEDEGRLDGYLKGRSENEQAEARSAFEREMQKFDEAQRARVDS